MFESRVILDGSQTDVSAEACPPEFESRVILDGSQTDNFIAKYILAFESRVILDGSQTNIAAHRLSGSLRVVLF